MVALLLSAIVAAVAGCGGGNETQPDVTSTTASKSPYPDPAPTLAALAAAARAGDEAKVRSLLTASTRPSVARELMEGLGAFPAGTKVMLGERIDSRWAVAALWGPRTAEGRREFGAFAVALKRVGRSFRAEIGPVPSIRPLGPDPDSVQAPGTTQVAAEFSAAAKIVQAGLWIDGTAVPGTPAGKPRRFTAYGSSPPLTRGTHVVVAFAEAGGHATALAWTFRVR